MNMTLNQMLTNIWLPQLEYITPYTYTVAGGGHIQQHTSNVSGVSFASNKSDRTVLSADKKLKKHSKDVSTGGAPPVISSRAPQPILHSTTQFTTADLKTRLERLYRCLCKAVIDDCLGQLSVLGEVYAPLVGEVQIRDIMYKPLDQRYTLKEKESFGDFVIHGKYTNLHKLSKDILTTIHVLKEVSQEISVFGDISSLDLYIESFEKTVEEEEHLFEEVAQKERIFTRVNNTLTNYKANHKKKCQELEALTREFVRGMKDDLEIAQAERAYTMKWEEARREQNYLTLSKNENTYNNVINTMRHNMDNENRCHDELKKYLLEATNDYTNEIEHWMDVYDREIDDREMDIYRLRNRIDKLREDAENMQKEYDARNKRMLDYLEKKRKKKEMERRRALENWAAIKIQAWWRGVMFRKKLGPYKKKKGKDKKKGGAKRRK